MRKSKGHTSLLFLGRVRHEQSLDREEEELFSCFDWEYSELRDGDDY